MRFEDEVTEAAHYLRECGIEEAWPEVYILAAAAMGIRRERLPTVDEMPEGAVERFREWIRRRGSLREPIAYVLGRAEFYGLPFLVSSAALIPRPATETLVERALQISPKTALDVGTGCGSIAVALAKHGVDVVAIDVSEAALELAAENARLNDVHVEFRKADLLVDGDFDLIAANPPYVRTEEIPHLSPEVRHEPLLALDGGLDGLDVIRRLLNARRGPLLMEVGAGQSRAVTDLALRAGFRDIQWWKDLLGIDRVLEAR